MSRINRRLTSIGLQVDGDFIVGSVSSPTHQSTLSPFVSLLQTSHACHQQYQINARQYKQSNFFAALDDSGDEGKGKNAPVATKKSASKPAPASKEIVEPSKVQNRP